MNRRYLLKAGVAGALGAGLALSPLMAQQAPVLEANLTLGQTGDYTGVPTAGLADSLGQIPLGALPDINSLQIGDLPNIAYLKVEDVPGLTEALGLGYCSPGCPDLLVGDVPGLLDQTVGEVPEFRDLLIGQLPGFGQLEGYDLQASLSAVTWETIPRLLSLTLNVFLASVGVAAIVPSMVELVTFKQYNCFNDGVLYTVQRGLPWQVGEYRYLANNFRIKLDSIIDHGPGTGYFHSEILVCAWFVCFWLGPFPWPSAYEQQLHLWLPPSSIRCYAG